MEWTEIGTEEALQRARMADPPCDESGERLMASKWPLFPICHRLDEA